MRSPRTTISNRHRTSGANGLAGWDIGLAAFALACMTAGFWRLWPGALVLDDAPQGPMLLKAGLAALGFVAVATNWQAAWRGLARNPLVLVLIALAYSSAMWALVPADALRNAIILTLVWVFGLALILRFRPRELGEICGFAGVFGLMAQVAAHQNMPPLSAFDGDIAFAIIGSAWAAWCVPNRRQLWSIVLAACCLLALAAGDIASLGACIGVLIGAGVAQLGRVRARNGSVSLVVTAWVMVAFIAGVTAFALFGAGSVSERISSFLQDLGPNMIIGEGFGSGGASVAASFGTGLGSVGIVLLGLLAFATLLQVLLGQPYRDGAGEGSLPVWFGALGTILISPSDVAVFGPICILFAANTISISLYYVNAARRQPLIASTSRPQSLRTRPNRRVFGDPVTSPASRSLNALGLRPKR